jgi:hypothetical protein
MLVGWAYLALANLIIVIRVAPAVDDTFQSGLHLRYAEKRHHFQWILRAREKRRTARLKLKGFYRNGYNQELPNDPISQFHANPHPVSA